MADDHSGLQLGGSVLSQLAQMALSLPTYYIRIQQAHNLAPQIAVLCD